MRKPKSVMGTAGAAGAAFLSVWAICRYWFGDAVLYRNGILNLLLFAGAFFVIRKAAVRTGGVPRRYAAFLAAALALMLTAGARVYTGEGAFWPGFCGFAGFFAVLYPCFLLLFDRLSLYQPGKDSPELPVFSDNTRSFLLCWTVIFLCWLPCYLAYYPGIYSYDIVGQTYEALGRSLFSRWQTTAHTFIYMICIRFGMLFGGPEAGHVTYSLTQMLFLSAMFSYVLRYLAKIRVHSGLRLAALLWFALNPMNAVFSFVAAKDVWFAALFLPAMVQTWDIVRKPDAFFASSGRQIRYALLFAACCLFRVNAIFGMTVFFAVFVVMHRPWRGKAWRTAGIFLASFLLIYGPVYTLLGVTSGDSKQILSIPMQQLAAAAAYRGAELTAEERAAISEILPYGELAERYNPRYADPVKDHFNTRRFNENPLKYAAVWLRLMGKYPGIYLEAFLNMNLGYWYPDAEHPDPYSKRIYIETQIWHVPDLFPLERRSFFPGLLEKYERFADGSAMQAIPLVSLLFSIGVPFWVLLTGLAVCRVRKQHRLMLLYLPAMTVLLTFMAGPVCNVRYVYFIFAAYPLFFFAPAVKEERRETPAKGKK